MGTDTITEQIILENKNLIYSIANIYKGYANIEDLYQAGCIGLIDAYNHYDSSKNTKFSSFAYIYILGEISKCVREDKSITISKEISSRSSKIEKVKGVLAQELGRYPTDEEVANYLDISIEDYNEAVNSTYCVDSLDNAISDDGNLDLYNVIGATMDIDSMIDLQMALDELDPVDRRIILAHYMYDLTQTEIAKQVGMNQVAVSRHEQKVISKLRQNLK
ncbi:MAG: sigma-70 family RNA polymerase sigma factor [Bacilli bacterium]|nr:sigma-70 family RNA polymerase sigma factor [Bacilli bacterium]